MSDGTINGVPFNWMVHPQQKAQEPTMNVVSKVPLVVYHSPCMDGFTAAWACWLRHPDWEYVPGVYGEPLPDVDNREVYLLDFSYKSQQMQELIHRADKTTVLDHHVTAKEIIEPMIDEGLAFGRFDMEHSGAALAWEWFHPNTPTPLFVRYVEDRDLWRFKLSHTKEFNAAFFSYEYSFPLWCGLRDRCVRYEDWCQLREAGAAILRKQDKDIAEMLPKLVRTETIGGYAVPCANLPYIFSSDAGHIMCKGERFAATYYVDREGAKVYSLRSDENGMDVSEIAKQYGGGGHKHAAGFRVLKEMK